MVHLTGARLPLLATVLWLWRVAGRRDTLDAAAVLALSQSADQDEGGGVGFDPQDFKGCEVIAKKDIKVDIGEEIIRQDDRGRVQRVVEDAILVEFRAAGLQRVNHQQLDDLTKVDGGVVEQAVGGVAPLRKPTPTSSQDEGGGVGFDPQDLLRNVVTANTDIRVGQVSIRKGDSGPVLSVVNGNIRVKFRNAREQTLKTEHLSDLAKVFEAIHDFEADDRVNNHELSIKKGEIVEIPITWLKARKGWLQGKRQKDGLVGLFPQGYLKEQVEKDVADEFVTIETADVVNLINPKGVWYSTNLSYHIYISPGTTPMGYKALATASRAQSTQEVQRVPPPLTPLDHVEMQVSEGRITMQIDFQQKRAYEAQLDSRSDELRWDPPADSQEGAALEGDVWTRVPCVHTDEENEFWQIPGEATSIFQCGYNTKPARSMGTIKTKSWEDGVWSCRRPSGKKVHAIELIVDGRPYRMDLAEVPSCEAPEVQKVTYQYEAQQEHYISLKTGDLVMSFKTTGDSAEVKEIKTGKRGMFPKSHLGVTEAPAFRIVKHKFDAKEDGELSLEKGAFVEILEYLSDGWVWVQEVQTGKTGMFPESYLRVAEVTRDRDLGEAEPFETEPLEAQQFRIVKHDYDPTEEADISLKKGDRVKILLTFADWAVVQEVKTGKTGMFPNNFIGSRVPETSLDEKALAPTKQEAWVPDLHGTWKSSTTPRKIIISKSETGADIDNIFEFGVGGPVTWILRRKCQQITLKGEEHGNKEGILLAGKFCVVWSDGEVWTRQERTPERTEETGENDETSTAAVHALPDPQATRSKDAKKEKRPPFRFPPPPPKAATPPLTSPKSPPESSASRRSADLSRSAGGGREKTSVRALQEGNSGMKDKKVNGPRPPLSAKPTWTVLKRSPESGGEGMKLFVESVEGFEVEDTVKISSQGRSAPVLGTIHNIEDGVLVLREKELARTFAPGATVTKVNARVTSPPMRAKGNDGIKFFVDSVVGFKADDHVQISQEGDNDHSTIQRVGGGQPGQRPYIVLVKKELNGKYAAHAVIKKEARASP